MEEQQPSKLRVIGSSPIGCTQEAVAEWLKAVDCKSIEVILRRFESYLPHLSLNSSVVEQKTENLCVGGSIPPLGNL